MNNDIQHGTDLRMARRCERYHGITCDECRAVVNAYQRKVRSEHPEWNWRSNRFARQRRQAMRLLSYRYPDEYESILKEIILKDDYV